TDVFGGWADELHLVLAQDFGKTRVLREKSVPGMHRVGAGDLAGGEQRRDVEITVLRGRRADAHAFVGKPHVHGVGVGGRVHRDRGDAQLFARPQHAERNLAAVGDEDFIEHDVGSRHGRPRALFVPGVSRPSTTRWTRKTWMPGTRPGMTTERYSTQRHS